MLRAAQGRVGVILMTLLLAVSAGAAEKTAYALTDVRVLYLYDDPGTIDWPVVYYLNDHYGCRVDLVTLGSSGVFQVTSSEIPDREMYRWTYLLPVNTEFPTDSLVGIVMADRRPDIVLLDHAGQREPLRRLEQAIIDLEADSLHLFNILKIYRRAGSRPDTSETSGDRAVTMNRRELQQRYRLRMESELPRLVPGASADPASGGWTARYELVRQHPSVTGPDPDPLAGIQPLRLVRLVDSLLPDGAIRRSLVERARDYVAAMSQVRQTDGTEQVERAVSGYRHLLALRGQVRARGLLDDLPEFARYIDALVARAQAVTTDVVGMDWKGRIVLRDSPHGPRLKFRAELTVNGPDPVELSYIKFDPYWDSVTVVLDSMSRMVAPHQSFVREYLVDIERAYLEATMPESLIFTADLVHRQIPFSITSTLPIWERPELTIEFQPDFHFVQPFARLNVDKVVSSMTWQAVIHKPLHYHGDVRVELETPRGIYAGAYRKELQLERGRASETIRIPFSVSNLFELGIHPTTISLLTDNRLVAADTGIVRIAACGIGDTVRVGFMPDTTGRLEDILRMTDAAIQPLTDRALLVADLDAFDVIIIGSGGGRNYPSMDRIKGRLEDYLRRGGSIVLFGQPQAWPEGVLPISFVPTRERVIASELLNRIPEARVMSRPYTITESAFLKPLAERREVAAAVISPAEKVFLTPSGSTLLSVSRVGDGQIIFCGFPLLEMVARLDIEAIHLFANLLNY